MNEQSSPVPLGPNQTQVIAGPGVVLVPPIPDHDLVRCVGHGAYGEVWLAKNVMGTFRAVKVVYRRTFSDDRPYEREFEGIKKFEPISRTHPGLVSVLHIGRNRDAGYFYYVMEVGDDRILGQNIVPATYAPKTLHSEVAQRGRLPAEECLRIALSLTRALGHLHGHGLIHRDVKPSNVIFIGGMPKLADIGLVTDIGEKVTSVGTEGYIPPEGPGSPAADLYSLGKVLFEIATGMDCRRFPSLPTRLHEYPDAPLLVQLNEIILKACDPNVRKRYGSADELAAALGRLTGATAAVSVVATARPPADKSVAVLPFVNMSADRENEYLSDGITEDLTAALAQVKGLRVAGRTSAFAFKGKSKDSRRIAEQLGVRTLLEGSVRKSGKRLRITAQLINASDGCCLWSQRYDREMKDIFALQDEISRAIVTALKGRLGDREEGSVVKRQTANTEAYQLYLRGRFHWDRRGEALRKGMHYFELALLEDPRYALAYAGLADSYNLLGFYGYLPPRDIIPRAKAAALKAVQLDGNSAEAHNSLGFSHLLYEWDWRTAVQEFHRALEINPIYSPAHYWLASYLSAAGRHADALAEDLRAAEFDPLSALVRTHLGWTYLHARDYPKAVEHLRMALDLDPDFMVAHWILGRAYAAQSWHEQAIAEFQKLRSSPPINAWGIAWEGYTLAAMGQREMAAKALSELHELSRQMYVRAYLFAVLNLALGRIDETFEWLQKSRDERDVWLGWIKCDCHFDNLQTNPRFVRLWQSLGLE